MTMDSCYDLQEAGVQPDNTLRAYDKEETRQIHSAIKVSNKKIQ